MTRAIFTACLNPIVSPEVDHGGGPAVPHQHVVNLVPGASVVGEPCHKVALWVLEASAGNCKAVRRRDIYQAVTISALRVICKLAQDMPCGRVHGALQSTPTISMSPAGALSTASLNECFASSAASSVEQRLL